MNTGNSRLLPFPLHSRASGRPFATVRRIEEDVQTLRFQSGASYERSPASNLTSPVGQGSQKKLAQRRRGAEEQNVDGGSSGMFYLRVPASLRENDPVPAPKIRHETTGLWIEFPLKKQATQKGKKTGVAPLTDDQERLESRLESNLAAKVMIRLHGLEEGKAGLSSSLGHKTVSGELNKQIKRLLEMDLIERTIPEKPNSRLQKYRLTGKGSALLNGGKES